MGDRLGSLEQPQLVMVARLLNRECPQVEERVYGLFIESLLPLVRDAFLPAIPGLRSALGELTLLGFSTRRGHRKRENFLGASLTGLLIKTRGQFGD